MLSRDTVGRNRSCCQGIQSTLTGYANMGYKLLHSGFTGRVTVVPPLTKCVRDHRCKQEWNQEVFNVTTHEVASGLLPRAGNSAPE